MLDSRRGVALVLIGLLLVTAALYVPGFAGYWLGDDFSNLHRAYIWGVNGETSEQLWRQFSSSTSEGAAFFRPLIIASLTLDFLRSGIDYGGWYAYNYAVHLVNMLLVACLVRRIAAQCGVEAGWAAPLAAGLFGLSPLLAEGVYWLSARSDASVTLFSLLGVLAWVGRTEQLKPSVAWLPICMLPALLFKESAALVPLQAGLVWLAVPALRERRRLLALIAAVALVAVFLAWRAHLFGDAWKVYGGAGTPLIDSITRLPAAALSLLPWMQGLMGEQWPWLLGHAGLLVAAITVAVFASQTRVAALALLLAAAGALLATLLNLGALAGNGEGGRLLYSPLAWLALAVGMLCARAPAAPLRWQRLANGLVLLSIAAGTLVLQPLLQRVWAVQSALKQTAAALPQAAQDHPAAILLLLPDAVGPVVAARNGQAAFVLRPLQPRGLIDLVLPTLPAEVQSRHGQYADGLLDQLQAANMQHWDPEVVFAKPDHVAARWPAQIACWSTQAQTLLLFSAPSDADPASWANAILAAARAKGCWLQ